MLVRQLSEEFAIPPTSSRWATSASELAALRTVLFGESIVDAPRLHLADRAAVDRFLRLAAFDTDSPLDMGRLRELHHEATVYLTDVHRYRLPLQIEQPPEIHDLFLAAATPSLGRVQRFACMTLKVMHIMHHISGRELLFNTPISEAQLFDRLNARIFGFVDRARAEGIGVQEFAAGQKSRTSLATKLLAKRTNLAHHIFDKLRFRVVLRSRAELVHTLVLLLRHLVPFNYVLPEQSDNGILGLDDLLAALDCEPGAMRRSWAAAPPASRQPANLFSGPQYRCVNFVADIPLRIDDVAPQAAPAIAFVQTEIQLLDLETARANDRGENAHALYKKRQRASVRARLESLTAPPAARLAAVEGHVGAQSIDRA